MGEPTFAVSADEMTGLAAVIAFAPPGSPDGRMDPVTLARQVLRVALDARLEGLGLPWAPSPQTVADAQREQAAREASLAASMLSNRRLTWGVGALAGMGLIIALAGGYGFGWSWTGFRANKQVWDWLQLLVLPLALATLPIWLSRSNYLSRGRRTAYTAALAVFAVFVLVGYEAPLGWTGFAGNRLWDWITLLLLPVTLVSVRTWFAANRGLRARHWTVLAIVVAAWLVTIVGGYAWNWSWTGYQGNTLWDWLQLTLAPLVIPTILVPSLLPFATEDAEHRAKQDRERAYQLDLARRPAPRPAPGPLSPGHPGAGPSVSQTS